MHRKSIGVQGKQNNVEKRRRNETSFFLSFSESIPRSIRCSSDLFVFICWSLIEVSKRIHYCKDISMTKKKKRVFACFSLEKVQKLFVKNKFIDRHWIFDQWWDELFVPDDLQKKLCLAFRYADKYDSL